MKTLSFFFVFAILATQAFGQAEPSITVGGEVTKQLTITIAGMKDFPAKEITAKDKEGKEHVYKGTLLSLVLTSAGVTLGKELRGGNLAKYVIIKAADGYVVVYSLAELDPELTSNDVLLATLVDGHPLPKGEGPFRLVAPHDKKPARWIREITSIKVVLSKE